MQNQLPLNTFQRIKFKLKTAKFDWRHKFLLGFLISIIFLFSFVRVLSSINSFFEANHLVFHPVMEVKLHLPFTIERRQLTPVPVGQDDGKPTSILPKEEVLASDIIPEVKVSDLVAYVRMAESSNGKAKSGLSVYCQSLGKTNEFGYRPYEKYCFDTDEEAVSTVADWFNRSLEVRNVAQSLCRYNIGSPDSDCEYYQGYLNFVE